MQIKRIATLISRGDFATSTKWSEIRKTALSAVEAADWPPGSGKFVIYPQSGKKSGEGNGVKPIRDNTIRMLTEDKLPYGKLLKARAKARTNSPLEDTWIAEYHWPTGIPEGEAEIEADAQEGSSKPGAMDAAYVWAGGIVCFEWETGNISSSHRSLNKLCLGLLKGVIKAGMLVVPSRQLYPYLTDRIGNISELEPYFPLWRATPCAEGVLEIVVIEHDDVSVDVPKIPKGTDGRAQR